jgi:hypothetical protein
MNNSKTFDVSDIDTMMSLVSSIFSELNIGFLIYHLEELENPNTLKLLYANKAASQYTGADLSKLVGKYILEAFPGLVGSDLPEIYVDVVKTKQSRNIGAFEYGGDENIEKGYYSVKAFPMPNDCVGIVFENITVRKQLEEMLKKSREQ